jgi:hypothetical protein
MAALANGWKIRRWVHHRGWAMAVPVFYAAWVDWYRLTDVGTRVWISRDEARRMMHEVYGADEYEKWTRGWRDF